MHLELQGSGEERVARDRILGPVAGAPWHNKKKNRNNWWFQQIQKKNLNISDCRSWLKPLRKLGIIGNVPQPDKGNTWLYQMLLLITEVLFFILLIWCLTRIGFQMLSQPCTSGVNPTWSWFIILVICCSSWCTNILLIIFASVCTSSIGSLSSYLVIPLSGLVLGYNWPHKMCWEVFPADRCWILLCGRSSSEASWARTPLVGRFSVIIVTVIITNSISSFLFFSDYYFFLSQLW